MIWEDHNNMDANLDMKPQFPAGWTAADEASYLAWVESTLEGQQELEDLYWSARAAEAEQAMKAEF